MVETTDLPVRKLGKEQEFFVEKASIDHLVGAEGASFLAFQGSAPSLVNKETPPRFVSSGDRIAPEWWSDKGGRLSEAHIYKIEDAYVSPTSGVILTTDGGILHAPASETVFLPNGVYDISLFRKKNDFITATVPLEPLVLHDIVVAMPIGAFANYGHFILDCLPTAVFMQRQEDFRHLRIIMPPMNKWHDDLLALFDVRTVTIGGTFKGKNVYYTSLMDHGLHNLGYLHEYMREAYLSTVVPKISAAAPDHTLPKKVYLARDGFSNRTNASEHALRVALAEQGFTPINPEVLSCAEQMRIAYNADIIVSASGAALANVFFASQKAKVFEIFPEGMDSQWVKQICNLIGCDYAAYFVNNKENQDVNNLSRGITYNIDVNKFVSFLVAHI